MDLNPLEVRVLGVLIEKEHLIPDAYPLSLNAIIDGVNQKTNRYPIMDEAPEDVNNALQMLMAEKLVIPVDGRHVMRYEHDAGRIFRIPAQSVPLICVLMLRGPMTPAQIRLATEKMHRFSEINHINQFMNDMLKREKPLVARLPIAKGARQHRWMHTFCGNIVSVDNQETQEPTISELLRIISKQQREIVNLSRRLGEVENLVGVGNP